MAGQTLYDKLWSSHVVKTTDDGMSLIYIDRQLLHEVTSPQAFEGIKLAGREIWRRSAYLAVPDHNVSTTKRSLADLESVSRTQIETLVSNCKAHNIPLIPLEDKRQGIVHIIGPEQGFTLPGITMVCGDSHTATHGAFAALAMGVGTSEIEHVMATQCLWQRKLKNMRIRVSGQLGVGVSAKDIILAIIAKIGTAGATGYAMEFCGNVIEDLSMEGRMTICNMAIEAGSRVGLVAVDNTTLQFIKDKPFAPKDTLWPKAVTQWEHLKSDADAVFDETIEIDAFKIKPQVTWGTSPGMCVSIDSRVPDPAFESDPVKKTHMENALKYMDLKPGTPIKEIPVDHVFIGSCTNARIEDIRAAAAIAKGRHVASNIKQALVVPGSGLVKELAELEGLDKIFKAAGFEWREPGCSMCLAMNADRLNPGDRCASTSNRNFEGRQGAGGRTHLVSPAMAAAAAIAGHFEDTTAW